jgi:hypothetical protein
MLPLHVGGYLLNVSVGFRQAYTQPYCLVQTS